MTALKQIKDINRIIFLKKFTERLLLTFSIEQQSKQEVKIERLKQKIFQPEDKPEEIFKKIINSKVFGNKNITKEIQNEQSKVNLVKEIQNENQRKPLVYRSKSPFNRPMFSNTLNRQINQKNTPPQVTQDINQQSQNIRQSSYLPSKQPSFQPLNQTSQLTNTSPPEQDIRRVMPTAEPRPQGFALGKIEQFLRDKSIQTIECSGPGKNLLIKRLNRINSTRISLGQSEITEIISNFSTQAKIPIAGGILKAAVGDLIISAVISEFVGSRFIINKITPYAILQG